MNDIIHLLWFMALWTLSLYMWCRWYRVTKELSISNEEIEILKKELQIEKKE